MDRKCYLLYYNFDEDYLNIHPCFVVLVKLKSINISKIKIISVIHYIIGLMRIYSSSLNFFNDSIESSKALSSASVGCLFFLIDSIVSCKDLIFNSCDCLFLGS
jgi:hypothetical protein